MNVGYHLGFTLGGILRTVRASPRTVDVASLLLDGQLNDMAARLLLPNRLKQVAKQNNTAGWEGNILALCPFFSTRVFFARDFEFRNARRNLSRRLRP